MCYLLTILMVNVVLLLYFKCFSDSIRVKTIECKPPELTNQGIVQRKPVEFKIENIELLKMEADLRRLAYKEVDMNLKDCFYDDSDMTSNYFLVIIFCKKTKTPLLSARYFFDIERINRNLKIQGKSLCEVNDKFKFDQFEEGKLFLSDRLSGNINNEIYQRKRNFLFALFYSEILRVNKSKSLILFARSEANERLLTKYIRIGFHIIGKTNHHNKVHWILLSDLSKSYGFKWKLVQSFFQLRLLQIYLKLNSK